MIKKDLVDTLAMLTRKTKREAEECLDAIVTLFETVLLHGDGYINLPNLGVIYRTKALQRKGVNPRTGEEILIPEKDRVRFKVSKVLKRRLNEKK